MRLAHPEMKMVLPLREDRATLLAVEHPPLFRRFVEGLRAQSQGQAGDFVLSEDWTPLPIDKRLVLVTDPFSLSFNERRQLTSLYKQTGQLAYSERVYLKTAQLQSSIEEWLALLETESPYAVEYEAQLQPEALLKQADFRFLEEGDLPLRLERFLKTQAAFCGADVFAFVNLRGLLSGEELALFYRAAEYLKLRLLMLETKLPDHLLDSEAWHLIDKDLCELYPEDDH